MDKNSPNDYQVGGDHYRKHGGMQHWDYAISKKFDMFQYVITKYVERWRDKDGIDALKKARHYLDKYIEAIEQKIDVPQFDFKIPIKNIHRKLPPEVASLGMKCPFGYDAKVEGCNEKAAEDIFGKEI